MKKILIRNANVYTMQLNETPHIGFVILAGGKIENVGLGNYMGEIQFDEIFDAQGGVLLPGFIDAHSHIGLFEDGIGFEGADGNEDTDPVTPQLRALDGINPMDHAFSEAIAAGVTAVAVSPGSANPIAGQISALKTCGRRIDDMLLKAPLAMKFALGENPKSVYHDREEAPSTRMATAALIREQLYKAQAYGRAKEKAVQDADEAEPEYDCKLEALLPLLNGDIDAHFHAHRADDIFTAIRIAKEFGFRLVLVHGTEAHLVADLLQDEHVPIISGPTMTDRSKPELRNLTEQAPGLLYQAGIQTAITVDHPEIPLRLLTMPAMLAMKAGITDWAALEMITRVPAEIMGLSHRIGTIETGKDADLVLFSGHPFDFLSDVRRVWINGEVVN